jgi:iron-sulfur cluster repair protein YtfE (RIC family)
MFKNEIIKHFLKDHGQHEKMIVEFIQAVDNQEEGLTDRFNNLRNAILKHINSEESMYSEYEPEDPEMQEVLKKIREQHKMFHDRLEGCFEKFFERGCLHHLDDFKKILDDHIKTENEILYPYFDEQISKKKPEQLVDDLHLSNYN